MWASHEDFNSLVEEEWQGDYEGTKQYVLCKKLQRLKIPLRVFNNKHFSHISSRVSRVEEELKEAQASVQAQPSYAELHTKAVELRKHVLFLKEAERLFYLQKAKGDHLKNNEMHQNFLSDGQEEC